MDILSIPIEKILYFCTHVFSQSQIASEIYQTILRFSTIYIDLIINRNLHSFMDVHCSNMYDDLTPNVNANQYEVIVKKVSVNSYIINVQFFNFNSILHFFVSFFV